ncbi:MAG: phosphoribosylaminoimidazolesuccinocarboxamide synthase [Candidatus Helarchaeota archaeon]
MVIKIKLGRKIAEGKTKIIYESEDPNEVIMEFKDDITAGDGLKHDKISGKGYLNATISAEFFKVLNDKGIPTHMIEFIPPIHMRVKRLDMLPVEVVCRRIAAGHLLKRLPIKEGENFDPGLVEFFYKDDEHHDPMINEDHLRILNIGTVAEARKMKNITIKVSDILAQFLSENGVILADFKIEFGRDVNNNLIIGDEINGDSCRLWDKKDINKIYDKDVYRKGAPLNKVKDTYIEFFKLLLKKEPDLK